MKRKGKEKGRRYIVFNREYFAEQRRKAWKKLSAEARKKTRAKLSAAAKARWAKLSLEERSAEMKRRAKVRERNRVKKG